MTSWTRDGLDAIGTADELDIAALRGDGTLRPYTTIWVVRVGGPVVAPSAGRPPCASSPPDPSRKDTSD